MKKEEAIETIKTAISEVEWVYPLDYVAAFDMAIDALEKQPKWITVSEEMAKFPCLACDKFSQIFIPCGVVTINNRYILPREIIAWMPMPMPYKTEDE